MKSNNKKKALITISVVSIFIIICSTLIFKHSNNLGLNTFFKTDFLVDLPSFLILFLLIVIISLSIILYLLIEEMNTNNKVEQEETEDKNKLNIPDTNIDELKKEIFYSYKELDNAYTNFDYEKLNKILTKDMYDKYSKELKTLEKEELTSIVQNTKIKNIKIENYHENINNYQFDVILEVSCKDYIIDKDNNVVKGDIYKENEYTYEMTFLKNKKLKDLKQCPNCNKKIENTNSNKCPHCNEVILNDTTHLIISEKKLVIEI